MICTTLSVCCLFVPLKQHKKNQEMLQEYDSFETVITDFKDKMRPPDDGSDPEPILSPRQIVGDYCWEIETRREKHDISHYLRCWAIDGKPRRVPAFVKMYIGDYLIVNFRFHQQTVFGLNEETDGSLGVINFRFYADSEVKNQVQEWIKDDYNFALRECYSGDILRFKVKISTFSAEFDDPSRFLLGEVSAALSQMKWTPSEFAKCHSYLKGIQTDVKTNGWWSKDTSSQNHFGF